MVAIKMRTAVRNAFGFSLSLLRFKRAARLRESEKKSLGKDSGKVVASLRQVRDLDDGDRNSVHLFGN